MNLFKDPIALAKDVSGDIKKVSLWDLLTNSSLIEFTHASSYMLDHQRLLVIGLAQYLFDNTGGINKNELYQLCGDQSPEVIDDLQKRFELAGQWEGFSLDGSSPFMQISGDLVPGTITPVHIQKIIDPAYVDKTQASISMRTHSQFYDKVCESCALVGLFAEQMQSPTKAYYNGSNEMSDGLITLIIDEKSLSKTILLNMVRSKKGQEIKTYLSPVWVNKPNEIGFISAIKRIKKAGFSGYDSPSHKILKMSNSLHLGASMKLVDYCQCCGQKASVFYRDIYIMPENSFSEHLSEDDVKELLGLYPIEYKGSERRVKTDDKPKAKIADDLKINFPFIFDIASSFGYSHENQFNSYQPVVNSKGEDYSKAVSFSGDNYGGRGMAYQKEPSWLKIGDLLQYMPKTIDILSRDHRIDKENIIIHLFQNANEGGTNKSNLTHYISENISLKWPDEKEGRCLEDIANIIAGTVQAGKLVIDAWLTGLKELNNTVVIDEKNGFKIKAKKTTSLDGSHGHLLHSSQLLWSHTYDEITPLLEGDIAINDINEWKEKLIINIKRKGAQEWRVLSASFSGSAATMSDVFLRSMATKKFNAKLYKIKE